jgi:hypothetical protein
MNPCLGGDGLATTRLSYSMAPLIFVLVLKLVENSKVSTPKLSPKETGSGGRQRTIGTARGKSNERCLFGVSADVWTTVWF